MLKFLLLITMFVSTLKFEQNSKTPKKVTFNDEVQIIENNTNQQNVEPSNEPQKQESNQNTNLQNVDDSPNETEENQKDSNVRKTKNYNSILEDIYKKINSDAFVFKNYVDGGNFQKEAFVCLLNVIYKNTQELNYLQMDTYLEEIKKIAQGNNESDFDIAQLFNMKIVNSINTLFVNFQNLNFQIRMQIIKQCKINVAETKARCEDIYKKECYNDLDIESQNPFSFSVHCNDLQPQKSNLNYIRSYGTKCYHECPLFYKELYNKCEMPMAYENKIYSSLDDCEQEKRRSLDYQLQKLVEEHNIHMSCKGYLNGTFYVPNCLPGFQKQLYLFCIPDCPDGMIPSEKYCLKRNPLELPNYIVFNFTDLWLSVEGEKKKFQVDREFFSEYKKKIKEMRQNIQLQNKEKKLQLTLNKQEKQYLDKFHRFKAILLLNSIILDSYIPT